MEILLETFVFFTCLMFWVVFFHQRGTLAKLRRLEASIKTKIGVLEDLLDRQKEALNTQDEHHLQEHRLQEQNIDEMLKEHTQKPFQSEKQENESKDRKLEALKSPHSNSELDAFNDIEPGLTDEEKRTLNNLEGLDQSFQQPEKIHIPRTQEIESFEDIVNISKAIEKQHK